MPVFKTSMSSTHDRISTTTSSSSTSINTSSSLTSTSTFRERRAKNSKKLSLNVPALREQIKSAPNSPTVQNQFPPKDLNLSSTIKRRPSIPKCVYASNDSNQKEFDIGMSIGSPTRQTPINYLAKLEGNLNSEIPYKNGPLKILPHLYLGNEKNASDRRLLETFQIHHIINVAKEVENPFILSNQNKSEPFESLTFDQFQKRSKLKLKSERSKSESTSNLIVTTTSTSTSKTSSSEFLFIKNSPSELSNLSDPSDPLDLSDPTNVSQSPGLSTTSSSDKTETDEHEEISSDEDNLSFRSAQVSPYSDVNLDSQSLLVPQDLFNSCPKSATLSTCILSSPLPSSPLRSASLTRLISFKKSSSSSSNTSSQDDMIIIEEKNGFSSIQYKKYNWTHNQENLLPDFLSAFEFIDKAREENKNVLVHCQCGVSRSASLIIAYVMKERKMNLNDAYEYVRSKSKWISPNMSLVYQLVDFEMQTLSNQKNENENELFISLDKIQQQQQRPSNHRRRTSLGSEILYNMNFKNSSSCSSSSNSCSKLNFQSTQRKTRIRPASADISRNFQPKNLTLKSPFSKDEENEEKEGKFLKPINVSKNDYKQMLSPVLASPNGNEYKMVFPVISPNNETNRGIMEVLFNKEEGEKNEREMKLPENKNMTWNHGISLLDERFEKLDIQKGYNNNKKKNFYDYHNEQGYEYEYEYENENENENEKREKLTNQDKVIFAPTRPAETPTVPTFWDVLG